jgi:hypothetical protein
MELQHLEQLLPLLPAPFRQVELHVVARYFAPGTGTRVWVGVKVWN